MTPKIYDCSMDELRAPTQEDLDAMQMVVQIAGEQKAVLRALGEVKIATTEAKKGYLALLREVQALITSKGLPIWEK